MTNNEGVVGRTIRLIAGLAVLKAALIPFTADYTLAWAWIEVVPSGTGLLGWSAVYSLVAISMLAAWPASQQESPGPIAIGVNAHSRGSFHRRTKP